MCDRARQLVFTNGGTGGWNKVVYASSKGAEAGLTQEQLNATLRPRIFDSCRITLLLRFIRLLQRVVRLAQRWPRRFMHEFAIMDRWVNEVVACKSYYRSILGSNVDTSSS